MAPQVKMTVDERRKYLSIMQPRYLKAGRAEKSALLDEMEEVTGMHRKSLTRLLHSDLKRHKRPRERGPEYGPEVDEDLLRSLRLGSTVRTVTSTSLCDKLTLI